MDKSSERLTTLNRIFFILCVCSQSLNHVWLFANPWLVTLQAPLSLEFSRQECWRRVPFPIPGDLPDIGIELMSVSSVSCVARQILYHCTTSDALPNSLGFVVLKILLCIKHGCSYIIIMQFVLERLETIS